MPRPKKKKKGIAALIAEHEAVLRSREANGGARSQLLLSQRTPPKAGGCLHGLLPLDAWPRLAPRSRVHQGPSSQLVAWKEFASALHESDIGSASHGGLDRPFDGEEGEEVKSRCDLCGVSCPRAEKATQGSGSAKERAEALAAAFVRTASVPGPARLQTKEKVIAERDGALQRRGREEGDLGERKRLVKEKEKVITECKKELEGKAEKITQLRMRRGLQREMTERD